MPLTEALGGLLGTGVSAIGNIFGTAMNNHAQKELAKYNWEQQIALWERNNAYNTPTAQMQRFSDAGLNPNLIYGQGTSAGNSTYTPSGPQMPKLQPYQLPDLGNAFSRYATIKNQEEQNKNLRTQNRQMEANIAYTNAKTALSVLEKDFKGLDLQFKKDTYADAVESLRQNLHNAKELGHGYELDNDAKKLNNSYLEQTLDTRVQQEFNRLDIGKQTLQNLKATEDQIVSQTNLNRAKVTLTLQQAVTEAYKREVLASEAILNKEKSINTQADTFNKYASTDSILFQKTERYINLCLEMMKFPEVIRQLSYGNIETALDIGMKQLKLEKYYAAGDSELTSTLYDLLRQFDLTKPY